MCYPPTDFTMDGIVSEKPEETLKINWVYGYRGRDSQDNIFCLPSSTSFSLFVLIRIYLLLNSLDTIFVCVI